MLAYAIFETLECRHQRFGDIAPAERAKTTAFVRRFASDSCVEKRLRFVGSKQCAHKFFSAAFAALIHSLINCESFSPGADSTALDTSTPKGRTMAIA